MQTGSQACLPAAGSAAVTRTPACVTGSAVGCALCRAARLPESAAGRRGCDEFNPRVLAVWEIRSASGMCRCVASSSVVRSWAGSDSGFNRTLTEPGLVFWCCRWCSASCLSDWEPPTSSWGVWQPQTQQQTVQRCGVTCGSHATAGVLLHSSTMCAQGQGCSSLLCARRQFIASSPSLFPDEYVLEMVSRAWEL